MALHNRHNDPAITAVMLVASRRYHGAWVRSCEIPRDEAVDGCRVNDHPWCLHHTAVWALPRWMEIPSIVRRVCKSPKREAMSQVGVRPACSYPWFLLPGTLTPQLFKGKKASPSVRQKAACGHSRLLVPSVLACVVGMWNMWYRCS